MSSGRAADSFAETENKEKENVRLIRLLFSSTFKHIELSGCICLALKGCKVASRHEMVRLAIFHGQRDSGYTKLNCIG